MVPRDHLVRALARALDLEFARGLCKEYYSHTGQPSVDPVVLFKMMLLGYLFGVTSERKLAEECSLNLAFCWYLGYDFDEATPNHSVISKARARFGREVFEKFFQRVLKICVERGLVQGEKIFADATLVRANASIKSLALRDDAPSPTLGPREFVGKLFEENRVEEFSKEKGDEGGKGQGSGIIIKGTSLSRSKGENRFLHRDLPGTLRPKYRRKHKSNIDYGSRTDPEASFIARPGKGGFFSYKYHFTVNGAGRVIMAVVVTPGAVAEEHMLKELLERQPGEVEEVCADSQYGTADNYALCWRRGIKPSIPRRHALRRKNRIPREEFRYVAKRDVYICPNGKELRRLTYEKWTRRWHYRPRVSDCRVCPLKQRCSPVTPIRTFVRALAHVCQLSPTFSLFWLSREIMPELGCSI